jgi:hypothetical protein
MQKFRHALHHLGLAGIMILIGAGGAMLERANASRRAQLEELKTQSAALGPLADESAVSQRAATFMLRQEGLRLVDQRLLALSAVAEMGRRVPENVRLLSLTVDYPATGGGGQPGAAAKPGVQPGQQAAPQAGQQPGQPSAQGALGIEGVVMGERQDRRRLSRFVIGLQARPC